jgi:5-methylcytosine-specific restriction endonuclease McrA
LSGRFCFVPPASLPAFFFLGVVPNLPLWIKNMKNKKINAALVWKQVEDLLVPRLRLSVTDRVVYYHLVRHSRLEGKLQFRFSMAWLTRGTFISGSAARRAVHRLIDYGAFRLVQRSKVGHLVEVRLPDEIPATQPDAPNTRQPERQNHAGDLEELDFQKTKRLRQVIHARERGLCFYCLCQTSPNSRCIDHVVPLAGSGHNSYRNLVSVCWECNAQKGESAAQDFLRGLYRHGRLTPTELTGRLRALNDLASGKLRPPLPTSFAS